MRLLNESIYLRTLETEDAHNLLELEIKNKDFFQLYTSTRTEEFYTLEGQRERIEKSKITKELDQYYLFGIFLTENDQLIGISILSEVLRGPLQSCFIGYFLNKEHNGKGYMTEAVRTLVTYAFEELNLHRIEAGVMPHNIGSIRVLEKAGFHKEGIARKNVMINGKWEDHQVLAIINENDK